MDSTKCKRLLTLKFASSNARSLSTEERIIEIEIEMSKMVRSLKKHKSGHLF